MDWSEVQSGRYQWAKMNGPVEVVSPFKSRRSWAKWTAIKPIVDGHGRWTAMKWKNGRMTKNVNDSLL